MTKDAITLTGASGLYLVEGIQLRERILVPKFLGRLILWLFFIRSDTKTQIHIFATSKAEAES